MTTTTPAVDPIDAYVNGLTDLETARRLAEDAERVSDNAAGIIHALLAIEKHLDRIASQLECTKSRGEADGLCGACSHPLRGHAREKHRDGRTHLVCRSDFCSCDDGWD